MEDTFFIKYILCHYAAAHSLYHKILLHHTQMRMHSCTNFSTIILRRTLSMTIKDAVAKCFEQLYDQQGIFLNELATHAGAYSKIDLLLHS